MPNKSHQVKTNFTAGELSPRLLGRVDLARYGNGLRSLENFTIQKHGGIHNRSGTRFVAEVKDSSTAVRLIPFQFSVEQTYVLEFGESYVRFYKDRGRIIDSTSSPDPLEKTAPYTAAQLFDLSYAQSADVLFLTHLSVQPKELQRSGVDTDPASWSFVNYDFVDGPYLDTNTTTTSTLTPSATTGAGITITASVATFASTDVGRHVRIFSNSVWGYAEITAYSSATSVTADVVEDFGNTSASSDWRLGAWYNASTPAWPIASVFHDGRLWFGGTVPQAYQTVWASVVGDFTNHQPSQADGTVADDDGVTRTLDDNEVNAIRWMVSHNRGLMIGTEGGVFSGVASNPNTPITPDDLTTRKQLQTKAAPSVALRPIVVANNLLFVQRSQRKLREMAFRFEQDQFVPGDLTILAEHIFAGGVVETAWQEEPDNVLWVVRADGTLLSVTYDPQEQVVGWARHDVGGNVESIAVIRDDSVSPSVDQLWMVVNRTIEGATKRYVEFLEDAFDVNDLQEDAFYVDSGLTYDGRNTDAADTMTLTGGTTWANGETGLTLTATGHTPFVDPDSVGYYYRLYDSLGNSIEVEITAVTSTSEVTVTLLDDVPVEFQGDAKPTWSRVVSEVTGLDHLEGEPVAILADGAVHPQRTVSLGAVTLTNRREVVHAGLPMTATAKILPVEFQSNNLDSRGRIKSITKVHLNVNRSINALVGSDVKLDRVVFRTPSDLMGDPPPLFTGIKEIEVPIEPDTQVDMTVQQDQPLPMNLLSMTMEVMLADY